jgi:hypothetical protein
MPNLRLTGPMSQKLVSAVVGVFAFTSLGLMFGVKNYYTRTMPQMPNPLTGHTVPVQGYFLKTVYVTPTEQLILYGTYVLVGVAVAMFLAGYTYYRERRQCRP